MKIYERFADKGYHSSIATTFGIDFDAYENMVLPRLRAAGCRNNLVLVDHHMLSRALSDDLQLPDWAGSYYTVCGASADGVFHPKLFLQLGREGGRVLVGSGNLTAPGIAGNLEISSVVECSSEPSPERTVIRQCWDYLQRHLDPDEEAQGLQIDWMLARTPWLDNESSSTEPVALEDRSRLGLLASDPARGILARFVEQISGPVNRLIVISPYWDKELAALRALSAALSPQKIAVLLDPKSGGFPKHAVGRVPNLKLYARSGFHGGRFIHAKLIIAEGDAADHVLSGSTNCTFAALGNTQRPGINEEASLFRECRPGEIAARLGLAGQLVDSLLVDPDDLTEWSVDDEFDDDIPEGRLPGQFVLTADSLAWIPSAAVQHPENCRVRLFDRRGVLVTSDLERLDASAPSAQRFRVPGLEVRPAFARVIDGEGAVSLPGMICDRDQLVLAIREPHSRQSDRLMDRLNTELDANPLVLEILEDLMKLDTDDAGSRRMKIAATGTNEKSDEKEATFRTLSYEEFIARRRPHDDEARDRSSLAGTHAEHVSGFLDRILSIETRSIRTETPDVEEEVGAALAVKDEFDGEADETQHDGPADEEAGVSDQDLEDGKQLRRRKRDRAARDKLVKYCMTFIENTTKKSQEADLDTRDFLRLRLLLMIVMDAATPPEGTDSGAEIKVPDRQLLPVDGDDNAWPKMIGKLLFCMFGGNRPAVSRTRLPDDHDQIPDDLIKCWATCYWCIQACINAPVSKDTRECDASRYKRIAQQACRLTLPSEQELLSRKVTVVMDAMSARYSDLLGLDADSIRSGHEALSSKLLRVQPENE